jgi:hypothetical protein
MNNSLAGLDRELQNRLARIERLETELFFEQIRLAGLKAAKGALLRQIVVGYERDEQHE